MTLIIIIILLTLIPNTHYNTHKQNNKSQHIKNGNNTIKLIQWNKGKANFKNKTNDLDSILSKHRPNIISLCEANINRDNNKETNNNYKDYKIEHTKMSINTNLSRNIIMIKDDIIYKQRTDLEDQETSTIWIEITIPNKFAKRDYTQPTITTHWSNNINKNIIDILAPHNIHKLHLA